MKSNRHFNVNLIEMLLIGINLNTIITEEMAKKNNQQRVLQGCSSTPLHHH